MPRTLLLADDSVTIQRVIELTFADEDIHVVAVSDGDEAIAILDKTQPDIVLADVGMPGRNGYEVARHIKETPRLAHIPVVLLTGAFEPIDQAKAAAAGCDGVLAKPFEPQLVIGRVKELLARARQMVPSLVDPAAPPPAPAPFWTAPLVAPPTARAAEDPAPHEVNQYFDRLDQAFAKLSATPVEGIGPSPPSQTVADSLDWFASQPPPNAPLAMPDRWEVPPSSPAPDLPLSYASPQADFDRIGEASLTSAPAHATKPQPQPMPLPALVPSPAFASPMPPPAPTPPTEPPLAPLPLAPSPAFVAPMPPPALTPPTEPLAPLPLAPSPPFVPLMPPSASMPPRTLPPLADAFAALLAAEQLAPTPSVAPAWPASSPASVTVTDEVIEQVTVRVLDRLTDRVVRETVSEKILAVAERLVREEIDRIKSAIK
jgi:CheY-like chemotaxis protein